MRCIRCAASAALIAASMLLFGIPGSAQQPSPALSPQARAGLLDAAKNNALPVWQREFMVEVAGSDGAWDQLPPPSARYLHSAVYDQDHDRIVVFGGYTTRDLVNDGDLRPGP